MNQPRIPTHWSPEQALAVCEYLQQLSEHIWEHYHGSLIDLIGPRAEQVLRPRPLPRYPEQIELFEINDTDDDDLPF